MGEKISRLIVELELEVFRHPIPVEKRQKGIGVFRLASADGSLADIINRLNPMMNIAGFISQSPSKMHDK
jgi:hypothetical protein